MLHKTFKGCDYFLDREAKKSFLIDTSYIAVIFIILYIISKFALKFFLPFIIGAFLAALVYKPAHKLSKKTGIKSSLLRVVFVILIYIAFISVGGFTVTRLLSALSGFISELPEYIPIISKFLDRITASIKEFFSSLPESTFEAAGNMFLSALNEIAVKVSGFFSNSAAAFAKSMPSILISSVVTVAASCYIAKDYDKLKKFVKGLIPRKNYLFIAEIKQIIGKSVFKFAKGYLIILLITYTELAVALFLLRVKYAFLIAGLIALIDVLPVLGTGTFLIPWSIIELVSGKTFLGIGLILVYFIITVVRNIAEPKIIGDQMGINPLFTLIFMFIGLKLFGVFGMIFMPIALIVVIGYYKKQMSKEFV